MNSLRVWVGRLHVMQCCYRALSTLLDSTKMTTRLMDALKTPPSMAAAAHMAYSPGWICQVGSHLISSSPHVAPKAPPTCT